MNKIRGVLFSEIDELLSTAFAELSDDEYVELCESIINDIKKYLDAEKTQPEIIRCKNCKHSERWYGNRRRCFLWSEDGNSVFDDGFCNYAEKK